MSICATPDIHFLYQTYICLSYYEAITYLSSTAKISNKLKTNADERKVRKTESG